MFIQRVTSWVKEKLSASVRSMENGQVKRRVAIGVLAGSFAISGTAAGRYFYQYREQTSYHIYINGKEAGNVNNPDTIRQWLTNKIEQEKKKFPGQSLQFSKKITIKKANGDKAVYNEKKVLQQLEREMSIKSSAAKLVIGEKVIAYGKDKKSIEHVLKQLKVKYINEKVKIEPAIVSPEAVFPDGQLAVLVRRRVTALAAAEVMSVMKSRTTEGEGQFAMPAAGQLSSYFGERWGRLHAGIDIAGAVDTPVYTADSGQVIFAGQKTGYGNCIVVDHGNGYQTLYGHLNAFVVQEGEMVEKGEEIAKMGNTGKSTGPHLHFEIHKDGEPVNPLSYVR